MKLDNYEMALPGWIGAPMTHGVAVVVDDAFRSASFGVAAWA
jgi:hypothetical protein